MQFSNEVALCGALRSVYDGKRLAELRKHEDLVRSVTVSHDDRRVISSAKDPPPPRTKWTRRVPHTVLTGHASSPEQDATIIIWDAVRLTFERALKGHSAIIRQVDTAAGKMVSCSGDRTVKLWDLGSGTEEKTMLGHTEDVRGVALDERAEVAVSCSFDRTLRVWDLVSGTSLAELRGHTDKVFGVALDSAGARAVSCSWDMSLRVWDIAAARGLAPSPPVSRAGGLRIQASEKEVLAVAVSADGARAVSCSVDGSVRVWDLERGIQVVKCSGHTDWAWGACVADDGSVAVSCSRDCTARVWDGNSGRELRVLKHDAEVMSVALAEDGRRVITGEGKTVQVRPSFGKQGAAGSQPRTCDSQLCSCAGLG